MLTAIATGGTGANYAFKLVVNGKRGAAQTSNVFRRLFGDVDGDGGLYAVEATDANGCKATSASISLPKRL